MLSLDAEKGFDSVNWEFLYLSLEKLGFNTDSIGLMKLLYKNPKDRIKIKGSLTDWFNLERSTRQGCCLSPTLFAIDKEPLAQAIREDEDIKGIDVKGVEHKIGSFADDIFISIKDPDACVLKLMKK